MSPHPVVWDSTERSRRDLDLQNSFSEFSRLLYVRSHKPEKARNPLAVSYRSKTHNVILTDIRNVHLQILWTDI